MPAKNSRKQYLEGGYYHVYNRGVEKRVIFIDEQDFKVLLKYLKEYLEEKNESEIREKLSDPNLKFAEKKKLLRLLSLNNFYNQISLLAFCLMPNHFHFFIKQANKTDLDRFMNSIWTRYAMYFNRKYHRVGHLFQGVYKAVLVTREEYYLYLTKYIHSQALSRQGQALVELYPSSFGDYIGDRHTNWIYPDEVLEHFNQNHKNLSYKAFIGKDEEIATLPVGIEIGG